jgi:hypothetical protein
VCNDGCDVSRVAAGDAAGGARRAQAHRVARGPAIAKPAATTVRDEWRCYATELAGQAAVVRIQCTSHSCDTVSRRPCDAAPQGSAPLWLFILAWTKELQVLVKKHCFSINLIPRAYYRPTPTPKN